MSFKNDGLIMANHLKGWDAKPLALTVDGETGNIKTHGEGGAECNDALISLTIKPR